MISKHIKYIKTMITFSIYHPIGGAINHRCERGLYQYEHIGSVEALSLEDAYKKAQNDFNKKYRDLGHRSTCVGDIITTEDTCHIVDSFGFIEVPDTVLSYIDYSNADQSILEEHYLQ